MGGVGPAKRQRQKIDARGRRLNKCLKVAQRSDKWLKRKEGCLEMETVMMVWETRVLNEGDDRGGGKMSGNTEEER